MNMKKQFFDAFASRPRPSAGQIIRPVENPHEGAQLRELLAARPSTELTDYEIRTVVEGNLRMLTPEAFVYFLPAFLHASLQSYASVSVFASELIQALTEPSRADVVGAFDRFAQIPPELGLPQDVTNFLRKRQLEYFDSGQPTAIFHERFDNLTHTEGAAILAFLVAFQKAFGEDFPFDELQMAIDRYWSRYRAL